MTGYSLQSGIDTTTVSAYCPICATRTIHYKLSDVDAAQHYSGLQQYRGIIDTDKAFIPTAQLCCSLSCRRAYAAMITQAMCFYGYSVDTDAAAIRGQAQLGVYTVPDHIYIRMAQWCAAQRQGKGEHGKMRGKAGDEVGCST